MPTNHSTQHHSEERFLMVAEVAERLRVSRQTVRNWIERGQLAAVRVGTRRVRVREDELEWFLAAGETSQPSEPVGGHRPARSDRRPSRLLRDDAPASFWSAALVLTRVVVVSEDPSELAPALRTLARHAEAWADELH